LREHVQSVELQERFRPYGFKVQAWGMLVVDEETKADDVERAIANAGSATRISL